MSNDQGFKTYVLTEALDSTAPIFQRVNAEQRARITKIPTYTPYLQITFTNKAGKNVTIRYKGNTDEIDQKEQIKQGILANERYTSIERNDLRFTNGVLVTKKPTAHKYLEAYPGFEGFDGICDDIRQAEFRLMDKAADIKTSNADFKKRVQAANKIADISLKDSQELLIRLNGSFYRTSEDLEENVNALIEFLDSTDESGIDEILKTDSNVDEKTTILIGRLVNAGVLIFDETSGKIIKKKGNKEIEVRNIVADSLEERKRMFSDYLNTDDGKDLKKDLEKDVKALDAA